MHDIYIKIITLLSLCLPVALSTEENPVFRVVNGSVAKSGQFPYQVALRQLSRRSYYRAFCGGALIRANKVLTAAHCVTNDNKNFCTKQCCSVKYVKKRLSSFYVIAATLVTQDTRMSRRGEQSRMVSRIITPEDYVFPKSDIAILITEKRFRLNSRVGVLPYATKKMDYGNRHCLISGYGRISLTERSKYLMWAPLQLIAMRQCSRLHRRRMRHFICTSSDYTYTLSGDSGSPLVCSNTTDPADKGKGVIVGVVSGARYPRGHPRNRSTFFTRVTTYKEFIESKALLTDLPFTSLVFLTGLLRFLY